MGKRHAEYLLDATVAQAHSRVGGPFIGTRTIRRLRLSAKGRESRRDSSETRQSKGWARWPVILALRQYPQGGVNRTKQPTKSPLSLDGRGIKGEGE